MNIELILFFKKKIHLGNNLTVFVVFRSQLFNSSSKLSQQKNADTNGFFSLLETLLPAYSIPNAGTVRYVQYSLL